MCATVSSDNWFSQGDTLWLNAPRDAGWREGGEWRHQVSCGWLIRGHVTWPQCSSLIGPQPHHRRLGQDRGVGTVAHQGQGVQGVLSSGPRWWWCRHNHVIYKQSIFIIFQPKLLISVKWRKILKSQRHLGRGKWEVWERSAFFKSL